ncbi:sensor histidine kinase [Lysinibacillus pakistanensis]|uniref:sensor histidine kinase n=1 Tax=Lysinibacillus pakistanensis TaxID=759811 RepID=UPI003D2D7416
MFKNILFSFTLSMIWLLGLYNTYYSRYYQQAIDKFQLKIDYFVSNPTAYSFIEFISTGIFYFSTYLIGAFFLITGIYTYSQKPNSIIIRKFFYFMSVAGIAITFSKPSSLNLFPARDIEYLFISLVPYFLINFFEYFPNSSKPMIVQKIKISTLAIAIVINTLFIFQKLFNWSEDSLLLLILRGGLIANILIALIICVYIIVKQWQSNVKWIQNQLAILLGGFLISFSPILCLTMLPGGILNIASVSFSYTILNFVFFPITLAYLLIKQEILDFTRNIVKIVYPFVTVVLTLLLLNISLLILIWHDFQQIMLLNVLIIISFICFGIIRKLIEPLKSRSWKAQLLTIQQEKQVILQQMHNQKFLQICSEHIIQLIHQIVDIKGASILWVEDTPSILYDSGLFQDKNKENEVVQFLLKHPQKNNSLIKIPSYTIFPMFHVEKQLGFIILGEKKNLAALDKEELLLLEKIQEETLDLFINAQALHELEKKFTYSQQASSLLQQFNTRLLQKLENERKSLSIFLHDEVLQNLLFILKKIQAVETENELEQHLLQTISEIREMCDDLHPMMVEDLGLEISLQALRRKIQMNHNVLLDISYNAEHIIIPTFVSTNIFRMIKELTNNAIKHANPTNIAIFVDSTDSFLSFEVADNGKGFSVPENTNLYSQQHFGLITIQKKVEELQGTLTITSNLEEGTIVTVDLPLKWSDQIEN